MENGEPSASQYAAQAIIYAKRTLELLSAEPSKKVMQVLVLNSLRAQKFATLADFRATKKEQDLRPGFYPERVTGKIQIILESIKTNCPREKPS